MHYTNAIDIWSIGCIMGELLLGKVVFAGNNSLDQLIEIIQVLGTPTQEQIREMSPQTKMKQRLSVIERQDLHKVSLVAYFQFSFLLAHLLRLTPILHDQLFPDSSDAAVDLLKGCWTYSPEDRIQAMEALAHGFYDELKADDAVLLRMPNGKPLPKLFEWSKRGEQKMFSLSRRTRALS